MEMVVPLHENQVGDTQHRHSAEGIDPMDACDIDESHGDDELERHVAERNDLMRYMQFVRHKLVDVLGCAGKAD